MTSMREIHDIPRLRLHDKRDEELFVDCYSVERAQAAAPRQPVRSTSIYLMHWMCARLKIGNVCLNGTHALVDGQLGHSAIHPGSAIVHRQPGGALCLAPVHGQRRGRLFLPFADDTPRLQKWGIIGAPGVE
jgi:hypothetical protein